MQREAKRRRSLRRAALVGVVAVLVVGSAAFLFTGKGTPTPTTTPAAKVSPQAHADAIAVRAGCPASTSARVNTLKFAAAPAMTINKSKTYYAHFVTTAGPFVVKLNPAAAPLTVNSFVFLAEHKFYNCVIFHRVIPGFVIQGGDPTGTGQGGPGYSIKDELPKLGHPTYPLFSLAMANAGPNTNGSQFFIVTGTGGESLKPNYSLFGQVISGQKSVKAINNDGSASGVPPTVTQRMLSVTVTES